VSAFTDRLVHAAAVPLVDHTPDDRHTDEAARKATAAVLDVLIAELDAWKQRIDQKPIVKPEDRKARAAQKLGLGLVRLKLIDAADEIRHPRPSGVSQEGGKP
jgi:hypothetical protein